MSPDPAPSPSILRLPTRHTGLTSNPGKSHHWCYGTPGKIGPQSVSIVLVGTWEICQWGSPDKVIPGTGLIKCPVWYSFYFWVMTTAGLWFTEQWFRLGQWLAWSWCPSCQGVSLAPVRTYPVLVGPLFVWHRKQCTHVMRDEISQGWNGHGDGVGSWLHLLQVLQQEDVVCQ